MVEVTWHNVILGWYQWVLVKLIGVNKGRYVTLKYFSLLINVNRKHKLFIVPETSISLICIVCEIRYFKIRCGKHVKY